MITTYKITKVCVKGITLHACNFYRLHFPNRVRKKDRTQTRFSYANIGGGPITSVCIGFRVNGKGKVQRIWVIKYVSPPFSADLLSRPMPDFCKSMFTTTRLPLTSARTAVFRRYNKLEEPVISL